MMKECFQDKNGEIFLEPLNFIIVLHFWDKVQKKRCLYGTTYFRNFC